MKKMTISLALLFCTLVLPKPPLYSSSEPLSASDYILNDDDDEACGPLGYGTSRATYSTVSMSMIGWGLGLAAVIAILAGVISQSVGDSSSTHADSSST